MKFQTTLRLSDVSFRRCFFQLLISLLKLSRLDRDFSMLDMCLRQIYKLLKRQSQQRSRFSVREQEKKKVAFPTWNYMAVMRSSKVAALSSEGRQFWLSRVAGAGGAFCWIFAIPAGKNTPKLQQFRCFWNHLTLCVLRSVLSSSDECIPTKCSPSPSTWNWAHLHWAFERDLRQGLQRQRRIFPALTMVVPQVRGEAVSILCLQNPILMLPGTPAPAYLRHFSLNVKEMKTAVLAAESPYCMSRLTERS